MPVNQCRRCTVTKQGELAGQFACRPMQSYPTGKMLLRATHTAVHTLRSSSRVSSDRLVTRTEFSSRLFMSMLSPVPTRFRMLGGTHLTPPVPSKCQGCRLNQFNAHLCMPSTCCLSAQNNVTVKMNATGRQCNNSLIADISTLPDG